MKIALLAALALPLAGAGQAPDPEAPNASPEPQRSARIRIGYRRVVPYGCRAQLRRGSQVRRQVTRSGPGSIEREAIAAKVDPR